MTHKVHPKIYRLQKLTDWTSRWLDKKKLPQYLEEDFRIREFLNNKIGKLGVEKIEIERFSGKTTVIVFTSRPGLIIGRKGEGVEQLKREMERKLRLTVPLKLEIKEVKEPWSSASLAAQWMAQQIEKRIQYRRVLKQALEKIMASRISKGAKVEVAGRLDGTAIARSEWLKKGKLPRQTIRANIDYAQARAYCNYGTIGVKVWIYKGEEFN